MIAGISVPPPPPKIFVDNNLLLCNTYYFDVFFHPFRETVFGAEIDDNGLPTNSNPNCSSSSYKAFSHNLSSLKFIGSDRSCGCKVRVCFCGDLSLAVLHFDNVLTPNSSSANNISERGERLSALNSENNGYLSGRANHAGSIGNGNPNLGGNVFGSESSFGKLHDNKGLSIFHLQLQQVRVAAKRHFPLHILVKVVSAMDTLILFK